VGHIGATACRIIADNHGHQRRLVQQLNGQMGAASPGQERRLHAFTRQRPQLGERTAAVDSAAAVRILSRPGQWLAGKRGTERCHIP
jgi:hypothetical protein